MGYWDDLDRSISKSVTGSTTGSSKTAPKSSSSSSGSNSSRNQGSGTWSSNGSFTPSSGSSSSSNRSGSSSSSNRSSSGSSSGSSSSRSGSSYDPSKVGNSTSGPFIGPTIPTGPSSVNHDNNQMQPGGWGWTNPTIELTNGQYSGNYWSPDQLQQWANQQPWYQQQQQQWQQQQQQWQQQQSQWQQQLAQLQQQQQQQGANYQRQIDELMRKLNEKPPEPPKLSQAEAKSRAEQQLNPLYDEMVPKAINAIDQDSIRRGFFGQMPAAERRASTTTDLNTRKAQAVGQLTNDIVNQEENNARSKLALAQQQRQADLGNMLNALQMSHQANQGNYNDMLAAITLAQNVKNQDRQFGLQEFQTKAPYVAGTWNERNQLPLQWTNMMGQTPAYVPGQQQVNYNNTYQQNPYGMGAGSGASAQQNESRIRSDANYRQAEIERAKMVIANRQAAGMPVEEQNMYLWRLMTGRY